MIPNQDSDIQKNLAAIKEKLISITATTNMTTIIDFFKQQISKLQQQLAAYSLAEFSYEFYNEASNVVEQITKMRLDIAISNQLKTSGLRDQFDQLVEAIRKAVYKHQSLAQQPITEGEVATAKDPLAAAQLRAKTATRKAAQATADAEKANEIGVENIEKIQELNKNKQPISQELSDKTFAHTLTICAKNAAAVLAADEAARALTALDEVIEEEKKKLS